MWKLCVYLPFQHLKDDFCQFLNGVKLIIQQCSMDLVTGLRHGGWGRYRQRGRYIQSRYIQWALYSYK